MKPCIKWVGGKRLLLKEIVKAMPEKFETYYEPFIGGGAVLFHLHPCKAVINDMNAELINLYKVIKEYPYELIKDLDKHFNNSDYFYKIRNIDKNPNEFAKLNKIQLASRTIFLNKTCFSGLYRVNRKGEFNASFANYKNPIIYNKENILEISNYLNENDIEIHTGNYKDSLKNIKKNDFVYFDPPYDSTFTSYTKNRFNKTNQEELRDTCIELDKKGIKFLLSNSSTEFIKNLYSKFEVKIVHSRQSIGMGVHLVGEVLISNYQRSTVNEDFKNL